MTLAAWTLGLAFWALFAFFVRRLERASVREGDLFCGLLIRIMQLGAIRVHRLRVDGLENVPRDRKPGEGLVIVANHTAFIDPLLVQSVLPFEVRWIMGEDMAAPVHKPFWDYAGVILVDRRVNESAPLRTAIKHIKSGGVIGVFPEGFIERPPRVVYPFKEGVGLIISRSGARVLPAVIDGTPQVEPGSRALWTPSRSRLRFLPPIDYSRRTLGPAEIALDLRRVFLEATGWPPSDLTPRWENGAWTDIGLDGREIRRSSAGE